MHQEQSDSRGHASPRDLNIPASPKYRPQPCDSYIQGRELFRQSAALVGAELHTLEISARGPHGEPLTIDIATHGLRRGSQCLLIVSGVHGVELGGGNLAQQSLLRQLCHERNEVAIVCIHAVNPWGAAWNRRVDENNVDLNRNFRARSVGWTGASEIYRRISGMDGGQGALHDSETFRTALQSLPGGFFSVIDGQYEHPSGLFYGGRELEESSQFLSNWVRTHLSSLSSLVGIDFHSGVGHFGKDVLNIRLHEESKSLDFVKAYCGDRIWHAGHMRKNSVGVQGTLQDGIRLALPTVRIDWILQEFGTLEQLHVLEAIRAENLAWQQGDHNPHSLVRERLRDTFYPRDTTWRDGVPALAQNVAELGLQLLERERS